MNRSEETFATAMIIREIYSSCMNRISSSMADSGLSHQQIMVVRLLGHHKSIQITDLCKEMALTKGTVSGILSRMESTGLIEKYKKQGDQRNTYVRFTGKGKEFATGIRVNIVESFDRVFENFTDEELVQAKSALANVQRKISKEEITWTED